MSGTSRAIPRPAWREAARRNKRRISTPLALTHQHIGRSIPGSGHTCRGRGGRIRQGGGGRARPTCRYCDSSSADMDLVTPPEPPGDGAEGCRRRSSNGQGAVVIAGPSSYPTCFLNSQFPVTGASVPRLCSTGARRSYAVGSRRKMWASPHGGALDRRTGASRRSAREGHR